MDITKTLIRTVVRTFYNTDLTLIIDALLIHSTLSTEDLAILLGIQQKSLRKLIAVLREDRLLAVHTRQETREGMQRPINKEYFYIDYHTTIDAIKYRIFHLTERVKQTYRQNEEEKAFHCPQCLAEWTLMDVLDKSGPDGFECHRCGHLLQQQEPTAGRSTGHEQQSRLMSQLDGLLKMLQQIDSQDIPNNDFDTAFGLTVPVEGDQPKPTATAASVGQPAAVKGLTQAVPMPLEITITTNSESTAAAIAADAQRKAKMARENALPVWHTTSTVTGERIANGTKDEEEEEEDEEEEDFEDVLLSESPAAKRVKGNLEHNPIAIMVDR